MFSSQLEWDNKGDSFENYEISRVMHDGFSPEKDILWLIVRHNMRYFTMKVININAYSSDLAERKLHTIDDFRDEIRVISGFKILI